MHVVLVSSDTSPYVKVSYQYEFMHIYKVIGSFQIIWSRLLLLDLHYTVFTGNTPKCHFRGFRLINEISILSEYNVQKILKQLL